jgi:hypothetical protein
MTTGSTDYGVPAETKDPRRKIYFKDFELELFIAARCIQKSLIPVLSDKPNAPLADLRVGDLAISVKHPDSLASLERNIRKFNAALREAHAFGIFAAGLEDAFRMAAAPEFADDSDAQEWLRCKRQEIENFGRAFLEYASRCEQVLATLQVATFPQRIASGYSVAREGNAVAFERDRGVGSVAACDAQLVAAAFNPEFRRWGA